MPANTTPIFSLAPDIQWGATLIDTANIAKDGTGTVLTVFTSDVNNGGYVQMLRFKAAGSNVQTVARIFINNGSTNATAANNIMFGDITLNATAISETSGLPDYTYPIGFALPAGYKINITIGTDVAAGYYVSAIGGKY